MLLGLSLSAHLTPQVSSADSSVTRDKAAECPPPLCGLLVAPALILRSAIETPQRRAWCYTKPPLPFSSFAFLHRGGLLENERDPAGPDTLVVLKFEEVD